MYFLKTFLLIFGSVSIGKCQLLGELAPDVRGEILSILINGTVHLVGNCTGSDNSAPATNYWIYTNNNPNSPQVVTEPSSSMCQGQTRFILLAHGASSEANVSYILNLKNTYLNRYNDACIISVNWGAYAQQNYQSSYCAAPGVASNVANFICALHNNFAVNVQTLHLVGHSMGAQVFGIAGSLVQTRCSAKIGRITGLDPAGPLYNGIATKDRLDQTDAEFVDVIHTNVGQFGYKGSCGHLDTFANCGYFQPGCLKDVLTNDVLQNITNVLALPIYLIACNHGRSVYYFQESINSDRFIGKPCITGCDGIPLPTCVGSTLFHPKKVIGEDCTSPGSVRNYVLFTNAAPPYAKG